jgi:hypothetical protein
MSGDLLAEFFDLTRNAGEIAKRLKTLSPQVLTHMKANDLKIVSEVSADGETLERPYSVKLVTTDKKKPFTRDELRLRCIEYYTYAYSDTENEDKCLAHASNQALYMWANRSSSEVTSVEVSRPRVKNKIK